MMTRLAFAALLLMLLAGCGQKGPLYLPDDAEAAERYGPRPAPEEANGDRPDDESPDDDTPDDES